MCIGSNLYGYHHHSSDALRKNLPVCAIDYHAKRTIFMVVLYLHLIRSPGQRGDTQQYSGRVCMYAELHPTYISIRCEVHRDVPLPGSIRHHRAKTHGNCRCRSQCQCFFRCLRGGFGQGLLNHTDQIANVNGAIRIDISRPERKTLNRRFRQDFEYVID